MGSDGGFIKTKIIGRKAACPAPCSTGNITMLSTHRNPATQHRIYPRKYVSEPLDEFFPSKSGMCAANVQRLSRKKMIMSQAAKSSATVSPLSERPLVNLSRKRRSFHEPIVLRGCCCWNDKERGCSTYLPTRNWKVVIGGGVGTSDSVIRCSRPLLVGWVAHCYLRASDIGRNIPAIWGFHRTALFSASPSRKAPYIQQVGVDFIPMESNSGCPAKLQPRKCTERSASFLSVDGGNVCVSA